MRVQLILEAIDKATAPIRAVRDAMTGLNDAARKVATVERVQAAQQAAAQRQAEAQSNLIGAMATAASVAAPISKAVKAYNEYEDALTDIGLKSDLSGAKLVALGERVRSQSRALNMSSVELLGGMNKLMEGGLDATAAEAALSSVAKAAIATKTPIADLSQLTVAMINNGKIAAGEVGRALSVIAQTGKDGNAELNRMVPYLPRLTSQFATMGRTGVPAVADIGAAFQVVNGVVNNMEGSAAGIRDMMNKITADKAVKAFSEAGIDINKVMKDAIAAGRPLDAVLETLKKFAGNDLTKINEIFGDVQAQQAARALLQNLEKFEEIRKRAMNSGDVIGSDFLTRMGLGVEKSRALSVAFSELWTTLGKALAPQLNDKVDKIIAIVNAIEAWVKANPELAANIAMVATAIVGLLVAMAAAKLALAVFKTGLLGLLGAFFKFDAAGKSVSLFARLGRVFMMLLAPVRILWAVLSGFMSGLISGASSGIAAVGGWGAAFGIVLRRLGGLARFLLSPLALLSRAFMVVGAAMMATPVGWIIAGIAAIAAAAYLIYQNWDKIGPWLSQLWASISSTLQSAWASLASWLSGLGGRISNAISSGWSSVKGWFSGIFSGAASALDNGWANVKNWFASIKWPELPSLSVLIGNVFEPVISTLETGWLAVKGWFSAITWPELPSFSQVIGDIFAPILSGITTAWNAVADWFKNNIKWPELPKFPDIVGMIERAFDDTITKLSEKWTAVKTWFSENFKWPELPEFKLPSLPDVGSWFSGSKAPAAANSATKPVQTLAEVSATTDQANAAKAAIDALAPAAQTAVATVTSIFAGVSFHSHGVAMMQTLATGIRAGAAAAVAAARETVQQIRDHLPHSPAKVGPLSDLDRVQFGQTLAGAINAGAPRALAAAHTIAAGLAASIPTAGTFAVGAQAAPAAIAATQPNFALATTAAKRDGESAVNSSGPISVNLTLSPNFSGSGGGDFIQQLRGALPNIGYELAEAIRAELDKRDRAKH